MRVLSRVKCFAFAERVAERKWIWNGDLLVNISIYVPEALNKEEKATLEKMDASDNFKPNTSVKEKIFKKFKSFFD